MKGSLALMMALLIAVTLCSLSLPQEKEPEKAKNLKVLSKNISHEELENVMRGFKTALGVKCGFCHVPQKDNPQKLDFVSDDNEHKEAARDMMRMTARINKKYFKGNDATKAVTCYTCHHGNEEPKVKPEEVAEEKK
jgi:cytochrome c553